MESLILDKCRRLLKAHSFLKPECRPLGKLHEIWKYCFVTNWGVRSFEMQLNYKTIFLGPNLLPLNPQMLPNLVLLCVHCGQVMGKEDTLYQDDHLFSGVQHYRADQPNYLQQQHAAVRQKLPELF